MTVWSRGIGDGAVEVGDGGPHKIFRRAHLHVGELDVGGVRMRRVRNFGIGAQQEGRDHYHDDDQHHAEYDWKPTGVAVVSRRRGRGLKQASHGAIVLSRIGEDFRGRASSGIGAVLTDFQKQIRTGEFNR